jgi:hypothetical protein
VSEIELEILEALMISEGTCFSDLYREIGDPRGLNRPEFAEHIHSLRDGGFINETPSWHCFYYTLTLEGMRIVRFTDTERDPLSLVYGEAVRREG